MTKILGYCAFDLSYLIMNDWTKMIVLKLSSLCFYCTLYDGPRYALFLIYANYGTLFENHLSFRNVAFRFMERALITPFKHKNVL